jgi:hypothetical protein
MDLLGQQISTGSMNTTRFQLAGAGTQTAALGFGGFGTPPVATNNQTATEEYDGIYLDIKS